MHNFSPAHWCGPQMAFAWGPHAPHNSAGRGRGSGCVCGCGSGGHCHRHLAWARGWRHALCWPAKVRPREPASRKRAECADTLLLQWSRAPSSEAAPPMQAHWDTAGCLKTAAGSASCSAHVGSSAQHSTALTPPTLPLSHTHTHSNSHTHPHQSSLAA